MTTMMRMLIMRKMKGLSDDFIETRHSLQSLINNRIAQQLGEKNVK